MQYLQFDISDEDGPTGPALDRRHNGLVRVTDGITVVMTGIHNGDVGVTVTLHRTEPPPGEEHWQEIVEISAHAPSCSRRRRPPARSPGRRRSAAE
ncbi:hypothetical protein ACWEDF_31985 [Micromonospora chersina]